MKFHDASKCELSRRWEKKKIPDCYGKVERIGMVGLCYRHRKILKGIVADAVKPLRRSA